jgi:ribosomal protein S18 acetylase RimI-like enzyme
MRAHLVAGGGLRVTLRPAVQADEPFLHALYRDRRMPELAPLPWGPDERQAFVDMQFRAQQSGYAARFPQADHWIVTVADHDGGEPTAIGRLLVDRRPDEHRIVDLVILTGWRCRGIGTALMRSAMADADADAVPVRLAAAAHDERLVYWYMNLGFVAIGSAGVNVAMERSFAPAERG